MINRRINMLYGVGLAERPNLEAMDHAESCRRRLFALSPVKVVKVVKVEFGDVARYIGVFLGLYSVDDRTGSLWTTARSSLCSPTISCSCKWSPLWTTARSPLWTTARSSLWTTARSSLWTTLYRSKTNLE